MRSQRFVWQQRFLMFGQTQITRVCSILVALLVGRQVVCGELLIEVLPPVDEFEEQEEENKN